MGKGFGRGIAAGVAGLFFFSFGIYHSQADAPLSWHLSLATSAHAQTLSCEFPPQDEPDGDGDECNPNYPQQVSQPKNQGDPGCNGCGNPINFATGNKYDSETDYTTVGPFPLVVARYFNSYDAAGLHELGYKWHASYSRSISVSGSTATVTRDDGRVYTFNLVTCVPKVLGLICVSWVGDPDVNFQLSGGVNGSTWVLVTDNDETETYNASGKLVSFANRAGLTQTFSYDGQGRLATARDPFGRTLTYSYNSSSFISQIRTPDGGVYAYGYDSSNRFVSVTYPDGSNKQYLYENTAYPNKVTGVIDENGSRYATYAYDSTGRAISTQHAGGADLFKVDNTYLSLGVVTVTAPLGGVEYYLLQGINGSAKRNQFTRACSNCSSGYSGTVTNAFDANGNVTSQTDFNGNITLFTFDTTRNLETSRTLASGTSIARTITTSWNPNFRLPAQIVDGVRSFTYTYDAHGNLLTSTLTSPTTTSGRSYTYNGAGQVLTATDPVGNVTTYAYDAMGNLASVTNALGQVTSFTSYDANGRPLAIQDPNGVVTTLTYNFRGQVTSRVTLAKTTTYSYDKVGQLTQLAPPSGFVLNFTYDAAHRLIGVADGLGDSIAYTLDAAGNRIKEQVFDPNKNLVRTHSRVYDGLNRLYQDIGAQNQTYSYSYDNNSNLYYSYNPLFIYSASYYDALNRTTQVSKFGYSTYFTYDPKSRLATVTDARGLVTTYGYDSLDDVIKIASPDTGVTNKTYDAAGNLITSTDANGKTTTYRYDALNRVITATLANGGVTSYQYDQGSFGIGHLTAMTDPAGSTTWTYNRYGQVISRQQQVVGGVTLTTTRTYTPATGLPATITYPSGATVLFAYDAIGRASTVGYQPAGGGATSTLLSNIAYQPFGPIASWVEGNGAAYSRSYDQDGRIAGLSLPGGVSIALTYDAASRITSIAETGLPTKSFSYDGLDRLTSYTSAATSQNYGYDAVGNRTSYSASGPSPISLSYTYDTKSNHLLNVSGGSTETYTYDAAGNTLNHQTPAADYAFTYNVRNRLNQSTVGAIVRNHQIDGLGERVAKIDPANPAQPALFVYDEAGHLMGRYNPAGVLEETVWLGDLPVAVLTPSGPLYTAPDHLGAPHQITNGAQQVVWLWDHDPFGNGQPSGSFGYNLRFPGQFYDQQTGLFYNYFRDYDPTTGRYVESDPIGLLGGINTYGYVGGNPSNLVDPSGEIIPLIIAGAVGGAVVGDLVYIANAYIRGTPITTGGLEGAALSGFITGGIGVVAAPLAGALGLGTGVLGAGAVNAAAGALGTAAGIALDPCAKFDPLVIAAGAAGGTIGGAVAGKYFPTIGMTAFGQVGFPRTLTGVIPKILGGSAGPNAINAIYTGGSVSAFVGAIPPTVAGDAN